MTRKEWIKAAIQQLKAQQGIEIRCVMSFPERLVPDPETGIPLCKGIIPMDRLLRGANTCSPECNRDLKHVRRWFKYGRVCRYCGSGRPRQRKPRQEALLPEQTQIPATVAPSEKEQNLV